MELAKSKGAHPRAKVQLEKRGNKHAKKRYQYLITYDRGS